MATAIEPRATSPKVEGERRFVVNGISWASYETLQSVFAKRSVRMTYERGKLEFMSPSYIHERYSSCLAYMIVIVTDELDIPRVSARSTTLKSEILERGLEPDECFYLENAYRLRRVERLDLTIDPPPDLAIEVEITTSALNRMDIYAALGVPEVWRFDGEVLQPWRLRTDGTYEPTPNSVAFPFLPLADLVGFLMEYDSTNDTRWGRRFRTWVREVILPVYRGEIGEA